MDLDSEQELILELELSSLDPNKAKVFLETLSRKLKEIDGCIITKISVEFGKPVEKRPQ